MKTLNDEINHCENIIKRKRRRKNVLIGDLRQSENPDE
jgi:hypothetical protein